MELTNDSLVMKMHFRCLISLKNMSNSAGLCSYQPRTGFCSIRLSAPLLRLRPRSDLINTLLVILYMFLHHKVADEWMQARNDSRLPVSFTWCSWSRWSWTGIPRAYESHQLHRFGPYPLTEHSLTEGFLRSKHQDHSVSHVSSRSRSLPSSLVAMWCTNSRETLLSILIWIWTGKLSHEKTIFWPRKTIHKSATKQTRHMVGRASGDLREAVQQSMHSC